MKKPSSQREDEGHMTLRENQLSAAANRLGLDRALPFTGVSRITSAT
jgi:hypothetical protein